MTQAQLYLKAIDLDPSFSYPYYTLGANLPLWRKHPTSQWHDDDSAQLYLKAIDLDPSFSMAYINLGANYPQGEASSCSMERR